MPHYKWITHSHYGDTRQRWKRPWNTIKNREDCGFAFCSHSTLYLCILNREAICFLITVSTLAYSVFLCGEMSFQPQLDQLRPPHPSKNSWRHSSSILCIHLFNILQNPQFHYCFWLFRWSLYIFMLMYIYTLPAQKKERVSDWIIITVINMLYVWQQYFSPQLIQYVAFYFSKTYVRIRTHVHIQGWKCQDSPGSKCEIVVQWARCWKHPIESMDLLDFTQWFDSPILNTRSWPKINAALDGNVAWPCQNNATFFFLFF